MVNSKQTQFYLDWMLYRFYFSWIYFALCLCQMLFFGPLLVHGDLPTWTLYISPSLSLTFWLLICLSVCFVCLPITHCPQCIYVPMAQIIQSNCLWPKLSSTIIQSNPIRLCLPSLFSRSQSLSPSALALSIILSRHTHVVFCFCFVVFCSYIMSVWMYVFCIV